MSVPRELVPPVFIEGIEQLRDSRLGHGPETVSFVTSSLKELNEGSSANFTACFNPHGQLNLEQFKAVLRNQTPPTRLHVPLALGGNHITALIIDIDAHGQSDVLFFNSLGNSDKGLYYREAKSFIDAVGKNFL